MFCFSILCFKILKLFCNIFKESKLASYCQKIFNSAKIFISFFEKQKLISHDEKVCLEKNIEKFFSKNFEICFWKSKFWVFFFKPKIKHFWNSKWLFILRYNYNFLKVEILLGWLNFKTHVPQGGSRETKTHFIFFRIFEKI